MNQEGHQGGWDRPTWSSGETIVETIRTETHQDKWNQTWKDINELTRIRDEIHHMRMPTAPTTRPAGEQIKIIDHIHEKMKSWEVRAETRQAASDVEARDH